MTTPTQSQPPLQLAPRRSVLVGQADFALLLNCANGYVDLLEAEFGSAGIADEIDALKAKLAAIERGGR